MKYWLNTLKAAFLLSGAVMGAGFLSGRELVFFFGTEGFLPFLLIAGGVLFSGFAAVFAGGGMPAGKAVGRFFQTAFLFADFVFAASMLAGLNELTVQAGILGGTPLLSAGACVFCFLYSVKGKAGAGVLSAVLMPAALILINVAVFSGRTLSYGGAPANPLTGIAGACVFAFMNVFVSVPAVSAGARGLGRKSLYAGAALFSLLTAAQAALILMAVRGAFSADAALPLLSAVKGGAGIAFGAALGLGMLTSFYTCFCNVAEHTGNLWGKKGVAAAACAAYLCSFIGLGNIVKYLYPVIGVLGAVYVGMLLYSLCAARIKTAGSGDNNLILKSAKGRNNHVKKEQKKQSEKTERQRL